MNISLLEDGGSEAGSFRLDNSNLRQSSRIQLPASSHST